MSYQLTYGTSFNKNVIVVDPYQTTSGTQGTAYSIPIATNQAAQVVVNFTASTSTFSSVVGGSATAVFARASGDMARTSSTTATGLLTQLLGNFTLAQPSIDIVANTSTQAIDVKLTGQAGVTINWHLEITTYMTNP